MKKEKILVIDDELNIRNLLAVVLRRHGFEVDVSPDGDDGLRLFEKNNYDVVITDLKMPGKDGIEVLQEVKQRSSDTEVVVITGFATAESAAKALDLGATTYITKPFDCLELIPLITMKALERRSLIKSNRKLIKKLRTYLNKKSRELVAFEEITDNLAHLEDHDSLIRIIMQRIMEDIRCAGVWFWVRTEEKIVLKNRIGLPDPTPRLCADISLNDRTIGQVIRRKRMVAIRNLQDRQSFYAYKDIVGSRLKSLYLFPLIVSKDIVGVLGIYFTSGNPIDQTIIRRLKSSAAQLSLIVKVTNLYAELIKKNKQLQKMQTLLIQNEALTEMGRLARGIAHEIGNPLGLIKTTTEYLMESDPTPADLKECLKVISEGTEKINRFILDMLDLGRPQKYHFTLSDINIIIDDMVQFVRTRLRERNITLKAELDRTIHPTFLDTTKMAQAVLNIFLNSIDAMSSGGDIFIRTFETPASDEVIISIQDTGPGIPEAYLDKIFTPFFTTKGDGGTGLGLTITRQIIGKHQGVLTVNNLQPHGTEFVIRLPIPNSMDNY